MNQLTKGIIMKGNRLFANGVELVAARAAGDMRLIGSLDCSTNPNFPVAVKGDAYKISVAGKIGGASGIVVEAGDMIICLADSAAGTQAGVGANWFQVNKNLLVGALGNSASYPRTTNGDQTLLAAAPVDRAVVITVKVTTAFAAGDGAAPIFDFGETDTPEKFKANLNTGAANDVLTYHGILSAGKALLIGATAATGTTSTGAITVTALAVPTA